MARIHVMNAVRAEVALLTDQRVTGNMPDVTVTWWPDRLPLSFEYFGYMSLWPQAMNEPEAHELLIEQSNRRVKAGLPA
jgi:hypothetical protein